tara:strand:+ start:1809 stop:4718 length:2910 start_codon:yes stop_codon:yes gene_type:complete
MSVKQFKFVSPGVFINEIDNSALSNASDAIGPTIIGRLNKGPALRPVKVQSYSEFINIFGEALPGGDSKDVWRNGNRTAPTYAAYAAQAYLRNSTPVNVVRLLGAESTDATTAGKAGWNTAATTYTGADPTGGAYGLYVFASGSNGQHGTGSLAAVWYCENGHIRLTGTLASGSATTSSAGVVIKNTGTDFGFKAQVYEASSATISYTTEFNFNEASDKFVRKVFNTNPTLTNSSVGSANLTASYWLGETYENWLTDGGAGHELASKGSEPAGGLYGIILPLQNSAGNNSRADNRKPLRSARTPIIFAQDLSNDTSTFAVSTSRTPSLFHFETINAGLYEGQNFKVSIEDLRQSTTDDNPYGTFAVVVRLAKDSDGSVKFIERYSGCNLDPQSENYIARKIGDKYLEWDEKDGRYIEYGRFNNQSSNIRVVMKDDVDSGLTDERLLPAGFYGPAKYRQFFLLSGTLSGPAGQPGLYQSNASGTFTTVPVRPKGGGVIGFGLFGGIPTAFTASFVHPGHRARPDSTSAPSAIKAYFGYTTSKNSGSSAYAQYNLDLGRALPADLYDSQFGITPTGALTSSFIFTLDDLSGSAGKNNVDSDPAIMYWSEGNRAGGTSYRGSSSFGAMLRKGFDQFTLPLFGGNDGLNVKEMEPFRNSGIDLSDSSATNYVVNSVSRAIESVADPEVVDTNMLAMPGLTNQGLITKIVRTCEDRADALAIVDLKGGYQPNTEAVGSEQDRRGTLDSVITNLQNLQENSSYACAYYPWVQIRDPEKGALIWVPPSVAAIGVFATTERKDELWFAPAGFNRGGLSNGDAGLPVVGTSQRLTSKERDNLYEANINPIANFPNEGIVVFGQKTLQVTPSALDRINVRRLMNYVKKEISRMATDVLFEPNVEQTWNGFVSKVKPFLNTVKNRFGLDDFKVVLDETTTTPELIDRNIVYAKIFLKPTKAIEYIAIDFNITNSGASFED